MWKRAAVIGLVLAVVAATAAVVIIFSDCRHNDVDDDCPGDWGTWSMPGVQSSQMMDDPMIKDGGSWRS